jgi:cytochrome c biogenesis protein
MTSQGVVKVADGIVGADGSAEQLGLVGFFYPTAGSLDTGALTSMYGDLLNPRMTFWVYAGDLGIDDGTPRSVYALDPTGMEQLAGGDSGLASLELVPGETVDLPNGLGTITFEDATAEGAPEAVKRYISLSVHNNSGAIWVLVFAILALVGLFAALFVPRRRMWVKATADGDTVRLEYAGLARGEDPAIALAVADLEREHRAALQGETAAARDRQANVK